MTILDFPPGALHPQHGRDEMTLEVCVCVPVLYAGIVCNVLQEVRRNSARGCVIGVGRVS